jgi:hypothetical protein
MNSLPPLRCLVLDGVEGPANDGEWGGVENGDAEADALKTKSGRAAGDFRAWLESVDVCGIMTVGTERRG